MEPFASRFADYTAGFDADDPQIRLKIDHTARVADRAGQLAQALQADPELEKLVQAAAWFHDLGRFEQVRRYHTYLDRDSLDHAALSARLLKDGSFLKGLEEPEKEEVIQAVAVHSQLEIPDTVQGRARQLARILRDADKLDILQVFATEKMDLVVSQNAGGIESMTITPAVLESLQAGKCVDKQDRRNALDVWMTFLGFFHDFNFDWSRKKALEEGFWRKPFDAVSFTDPATAAKIQGLLNQIEQGK